MVHEQQQSPLNSAGLIPIPMNHDLVPYHQAYKTFLQQIQSRPCQMQNSQRLPTKCVTINDLSEIG